MDDLYSSSPKFNFGSKIKELFQNLKGKGNAKLIVSVVAISIICGLLAGSVPGIYFYYQTQDSIKKMNASQNNSSLEEEYSGETTQEAKTIKVIKDVYPAVVSVIISKDVPIYEQYYTSPFDGDSFFGQLFLVPQQRQVGTKKEEVGGGTGIIISSDGTILTNKHVVSDEDAEYTIFTNDGEKYPAKVLAKDPVQDLAILKVDREKDSSIPESFSYANLGDSDKIQLGQTVIAIGNALGEYENTVSVGIISGLGRTITASGAGLIETLEDTIQTDAAINQGNSGGPLLNLKGEVIGINTATVIDAQSIAFSIPINKAKRDIEQVKTIGKIVYPFLGVRYILVNEDIKEEQKLSVDYGALITAGESDEDAVSKDSAAEQAGLKENDIILELNGEKITSDNSLAKIISKYNPGDKIALKVLRGDKEENFELILGERTE